jgi:hypothetical protein
MLYNVHGVPPAFAFSCSLAFRKDLFDQPPIPIASGCYATFSDPNSTMLNTVVDFGFIFGRLEKSGRPHGIGMCSHLRSGQLVENEGGRNPRFHLSVQKNATVGISRGPLSRAMATHDCPIVETGHRERPPDSLPTFTAPRFYDRSNRRMRY